MNVLGVKGMDDNININIKFDDYSEVNATCEVLEDLLDKQYMMY